MEQDSSYSSLTGNLNFLREIVQNSIEGIAVIQDLKYVFMNPRFRLIFGIDGDKQVNISPLELVPDLDSKIAMDWFRGFLEGKQNPDVYSLKPRRKDGTCFDADASFTPISIGNSPALMVVIRDVSGRKELERRQMQYALTMDNAAKVKSKFLVELSHNLRNELNTIIGYTERLMDFLRGTTRPDEKKYIDAISESGETLRSLVENIITIDDLEEKKIKFDLKIVNLELIYQRIFHSYSTSAVDRRINLNFAKPSKSVMLYCDEARLREVISIILENSFNRTPRDGQISVDARESGVDVVISIFDTGMQIPKDMLLKMFDYVGYIDMNTPGANLQGGLEILLAKSIIEVMGGKIWVEHGPVEGNIFYISMPRATQSIDNQVNT